MILELDPPKAKGRKRVNQRKMLEGVIFRMRFLPMEPLAQGTGDDSTIHRTFQRWVEGGVLERVWAVLIEECRELDGVNWEWQSADCSMGKARFGGALLDAIPRTGARLGARKASWSTGLADH